MLAANGVRVEIEGDDLIVHGTGRPPAGGGMVETHMDHRLAMSALVLGLATERPVAVDDASFIDTSFPGFVELMNGAGAATGDAARRPASPTLIIAIDGPAAAGKGTLARRLAAHFGLPYLDTGLLYRAVGRRGARCRRRSGRPGRPPRRAARACGRPTWSAADLRGPAADAAAAAVAAIPGVRAALLEFQRDFAQHAARCWTGGTSARWSSPMRR